MWPLKKPSRQALDSDMAPVDQRLGLAAEPAPLPSAPRFVSPTPRRVR